MRKVKTNFVINRESEISLCPYCGSQPIAESTIKSDIFMSDKVTRQNATCPSCGLSAELTIWEAIAAAIPEQICKDAEAESA
jgi:transcription elongation factor Elf1